MQRPPRNVRSVGAQTLDRRTQLPGSRTSDESLLQREFERPDFLQTDPWRVFRIMSEFIEGFGTLDELFEALTLIQTGKLQHFPVVLVGVEYWSGMEHWMLQRLVGEQKITPGDLDLLTVTDSVDEVVATIEEAQRASGRDPDQATGPQPPAVSR